MALTWRYVVQPDGDFCRIANIDGSLDDISDEELARLWSGVANDEQPNRPCSRCGTTLLLQWNGPLVTGVWMELCATCDAHRPAARRSSTGTRIQTAISRQCPACSRPGRPRP